MPLADRPRRPNRREWRDSAIVGAALLFGGMGMVALGEKTVPAGIAAILIALLPVWVAVLGRIFFGERLPAAVIAGIAIGFAGVVILVGPFGGTGGNLAFDEFGLLCLLISPLCWGAGSLYSSHRAVLPRRPLTATGLQMICGGGLLLVGSILVGESSTFDIAAVSTRSWLGLLYLTTIGSLVGFTTYVWLLRVAPLPKIATYAYVNPVVAFVLGRDPPGRGDRSADAGRRRGDRVRGGTDRHRSRTSCSRIGSGHRGDPRGDHRGGQPDTAPRLTARRARRPDRLSLPTRTPPGPSVRPAGRGPSP